MTQTVENIPLLMEKVDALYEDAVKRGKPFTKLSATRDKIIAARGWTPALPTIEPNFDRILTELKVVYVPKVLTPGPMFLFPVMDTEGEINYAQTKPLEGSVYYGRKYSHLGIKPVGPLWFGNSLHTIRKIVESGVAGLVEGPFDLLASRLVSPEAPVLTPLTKRIGKEHIAYLRMLGIHTLYFLYDNEASAKGQTAAYLQAQDVKTNMKSVVLRCPAADPSDALRTTNGTLALKSLLDHLV